MVHGLVARDTWGLMCLHLQGLSPLLLKSGPASSPLQALFKLRKAVGFILHLDALGLDALG